MRLENSYKKQGISYFLYKNKSKLIFSPCPRPFAAPAAGAAICLPPHIAPPRKRFFRLKYRGARAKIFARAPDFNSI